MTTLLFVYGTLKSGGCNHGQMVGQTLVGPARTVPGFRLFDVGGYPGLVSIPTDREGVVGEVWRVSAEALERLDAFEGVAEGLYRRERVPLLAPFADQGVEAYFFASGVAGRRDLGSEWIEPPTTRGP